MNTPPDLKKLYSEHRWYMQGITGTPLLLGSSAASGFVLACGGAGEDFTHFLFRFENDQAEMLYDLDDLERLWKQLRQKILADEKYLDDVKRRYDDTFESFRPIFAEAWSEQLAERDEETLVQLFHNTVRAQRDSVGLGHILEPISIVGSDEIRARIVSESVVQDSINQYISDLFEPSAQSFLAQEEQELRMIAHIRTEDRDELLREHLGKYFWLENTYASTDTVTIDSLTDRLHRLEKESGKSLEPHRFADKERLMEEMNLSEETRRLIRALNFCTIWQDERKKKILETLSSFDAVLKEVARRTGIDRTVLRYLGPYEALGMKTLSDVQVMAQVLTARRIGCYCLIESEDDSFSSTVEFRAVSSVHHTVANTMDQPQEIRGMIANLGTAIGRVKVCTSAEDLRSFPDGAILVAHMTRPEYAPIMKKSAAIITDEGGITSHAAIVSRELGVPCIIGTKIATQVLHDGDMVEVRANHGYIRILERVPEVV